MKKGYIYSAILGTAFFAVPYLALGVAALPSAAIGAAAFVSGSLIFKDNKKDLIYSNDENVSKLLQNANLQIKELEAIIPKLEDDELVKNVREVCSTTKKIIKTIEKKNDKLGQVNNFLNYYLPVTIKILTRYDEIENQKLTTENSAKFMSSVKDMVSKIKNAFEQQLDNLYQSDMIDTDAEIKVFESMLKSDGFIEEMDFKNK